MKRTAIAIAALAGGLLAAPMAVAQQTVYSNDFSSNANGFSGGALTTSPSGNQFLYLGGAGGSATLNLTGLTGHSAITLTFSLYSIGSMDGYDYNGQGIPGGDGAYGGDYFQVTSPAGTPFNAAFANYGGSELQNYPAAMSAPGTGAASINALGYSGFPQTTGGFQDAEYAITLSTMSTSPTFSYTFNDHSNEGTGNEFYGIDNVVVSVTPTAAGVPEPATWAMMMLGFGAVGFAMRHRRRGTRAAFA